MRDGGKEVWGGLEEVPRRQERKDGYRETESERKGFTVRETNVREEGRQLGGGKAMWEEKRL